MKSSINIIGINWQCNSSACLMINGEIVDLQGKGLVELKMMRDI